MQGVGVGLPVWWSYWAAGVEEGKEHRVIQLVLHYPVIH